VLGHTAGLQNGTYGLSSLVLGIDGCVQKKLHAQCCHYPATSAAFTGGD